MALGKYGWQSVSQNALKQRWLPAWSPLGKGLPFPRGDNTGTNGSLEPFEKEMFFFFCVFCVFCEQKPLCFFASFAAKYPLRPLRLLRRLFFAAYSKLLCHGCYFWTCKASIGPYPTRRKCRIICAVRFYLCFTQQEPHSPRHGGSRHGDRQKPP